MRKATLIFLVKKNNGEVAELCLARKRKNKSFGGGRWNGVGGKVEEGETFEEGARREAFEEIGVKLGRLDKVGEITFIFPHEPKWDQQVEVFFAHSWEGEPSESEEMVSPTWFKAGELPFEMMWEDDQYWLPVVLSGKLISAVFTFGQNDVILDKKVDQVGAFIGKKN